MRIQVYMMYTYLGYEISVLHSPGVIRDLSMSIMHVV